MAGLGKSSLIAVAFLVIIGAAPLARATTAPSDPCSLLSASDVSNATGSTYTSTQSTVAPRPYANTVQGTDCRYSSGSHELLFRIYFDPSTDDTTSLFAKLKMFYSPPTPVPGVGDEAYFDPHNGLHIRKGNIRYFLPGKPSNAQLRALATLVAGKL
jgi:hypothetical protein